MSGNTARIDAYDYRKVGKEMFCATELKRMPRSVDVVFPRQGQARVAASGQRRGKTPTVERVPTSIERRVDVE